MSPFAVVGAVVMVGAALVYFQRVQSLRQAPMPSEPSRIDPTVGVRFLGTAKVDGRVAAWPHGELLADRDHLMIRARSGRWGSADVVVARTNVRSVSIEGGRVSRRVVVHTTGPQRSTLADVRFGAAFADPGPALTNLGWPVDTP